MKTCNCDICKMTIQQAKQLAFLNYLFDEITIEEYDNINEMLNNYGKSHKKNGVLRPD